MRSGISEIANLLTENSNSKSFLFFLTLISCFSNFEDHQEVVGTCNFQKVFSRWLELFVVEPARFRQVERRIRKSNNRFLSENAVIEIGVFREIQGSNGVE
jgi:hypothetical protein